MNEYAIGRRIVPRKNRPPGSEFPTPQPPVPFALDSRYNISPRINRAKFDSTFVRMLWLRDTKAHSPALSPMRRRERGE
ncbi:KR domain-containing protein [Aspergillus luchuensis]|uniref:KR domain-containing protein n=1 Tax=Aspergillus kawachii TaxID=1069201 RepID=A0A146G186_ASPKA|nr:KR domain-containing protein [Aspergillus luchuensis]